MNSKLISRICPRCNTYVNVENGDNCKCGQKNEDKKCSTEFKSFYSEECKTMITSSRQMDRVYKQNGLRPLGDAPFRKKFEAIHKNKGDYLQQRYSKEMGVKYTPGSDVRWSDQRRELIPTNLWMREKAMGK